MMVLDILPLIRRLHDDLVPERPFSPWPIASMQLHQTGHSSIAPRFRRIEVGWAGELAKSRKFTRRLVARRKKFVCDTCHLTLAPGEIVKHEQAKVH